MDVRLYGDDIGHISRRVTPSIIAKLAIANVGRKQFTLLLTIELKLAYSCLIHCFAHFTVIENKFADTITFFPPVTPHCSLMRRISQHRS